MQVGATGGENQQADAYIPRMIHIVRVCGSPSDRTGWMVGYPRIPALRLRWGLIVDDSDDLELLS